MQLKSQAYSTLIASHAQSNFSINYICFQTTLDYKQLKELGQPTTMPDIRIYV